MASAVELETPPVQYSAASDEPFLRWTIFEALVALLCVCGALLPLYFAITGAPDMGELNSTRLMLFGLSILLAIALVCLIDVRRRVLDMREGPHYVMAVIRNKRADLFGLGGLFGVGGQVEVEERHVCESRTEASVKFQVSKADFDRIHTGDELRLLKYPHTDAHAASEFYDYEAKGFVRFSPVSRYSNIWDDLAYLSQSTAWSLVLMFLVLLLFPLWLLAYLLARIAARRAQRQIRSPN